MSLDIDPEAVYRLEQGRIMSLCLETQEDDDVTIDHGEEITHVMARGRHATYIDLTAVTLGDHAIHIAHKRDGACVEETRLIVSVGAKHERSQIRSSA